MLIQKNSTNRIRKATHDADNDQSIFVLTILEKIKETILNFSHESITVLQKMANYQETRVKLTNAQLNQLKSEAKNKIGTILKTNKTNFQDEELPQEYV